MTVLIKYVDFHCDNHQGASGKSFQFSHVLKLPDSLVIGDFWIFIHSELEKITRMKRPFPKAVDGLYAIQSVQVFEPPEVK